MYVRTVSAQEYFHAFPAWHVPYSSPEFIQLVSDKAEMVRYFIGYVDAEPRMGIVLGLKDNLWQAPFSAPYAEFASSATPSIEEVYDFINELADVLRGARFQITLPPPIYCQHHALYNAVLGNLASKCIFDYNYHYPLHQASHLEKNMDRKARNQLYQAQRNGLTCIADAPMQRVYDCAFANHQAKGYPVRMSLDQFYATRQYIAMDCFLVQRQGEDVAGAISYHTAPGIAQLILWGDKPGYSHLRPMNMLSAFAIRYYAEAGYEFLDFGPSSSRGVPAIGLCHFKKGLGCILSLKPTYIFG